MSNLLDGIKNYLKMNSTGALMVSGDWGCGKTYHIDNVVIPSLIEDGYEPIKVSLFGIESINDIPLRIAENYKGISRTKQADEVNENKKKERKRLFGKKEVGKVVAKGSQLISSITWLSNFVDVNTLVGKYSDLLYELIPKEKTVIFLDDMERVIDTIDLHMLLGAINGLVEQRGYKVVVIANNSYIQQQEADRLVFKEKVIEKTLVYDPDVVAIYKEICEKDYNPPFKDFMQDVKALSVIDPRFIAYKEDEGLITDLHNIRIVKFALSHFNKVYEVCYEFLKEEDKNVADIFLYSLWACTVGLAVEYKRNRLTYKDREQFANYVDLSLPLLQYYDGNDDQENLFDEKDEKSDDEAAQKEEARKRAYKSLEHIFKGIVKIHGLPEIVAPQIFDFVIAGKLLNSSELKTLWENYKIQVQRNAQSPAYALLNRFLQAQWSMSNEEMVDALAKLAKYVEDGEYNDNLSYVKAATFLQHMISLTIFSQQDLKDKIIAGIDKMYAKITTISVLEKINLNVSETHIPKISQWVVDYEKKKMDEVSALCLKEDIKEVCRQFNEDLEALEKRLIIPYGSTKAPDFVDYPILRHIPYEDIVRKINKIQPKEVMALYDIINTRFFQMVNQTVYTEEMQFVKNLHNALKQRKPEKKEYADILIEDQLNKLVEKVLNQK
jgi:hypothetical protein